MLSFRKPLPVILSGRVIALARSIEVSETGIRLTSGPNPHKQVNPCKHKRKPQKVRS